MVSVSYENASPSNCRYTNPLWFCTKQSTAVFQQSVRQGASCFVGIKQGFFLEVPPSSGCLSYWGLTPRSPQAVLRAGHLLPRIPASSTAPPHAPSHTSPFSSLTQLLPQPSPGESLRLGCPLQLTGMGIPSRDARPGGGNR